MTPLNRDTMTPDETNLKDKRESAPSTTTNFAKSISKRVSECRPPQHHNQFHLPASLPAGGIANMHLCLNAFVFQSWTFYMLNLVVCHLTSVW